MKFTKVFLGSLFAMFLVFIAIILLPCDFSNTCFASLDTHESRRTFILDTLQKYSPTGYHIVNMVDTSNPPRGMTWNRFNFAFVDGNSEIEILDDMATIVHETCHVYAGRMAYVVKKRMLYGTWYAYYTGTETIPIQTTETFPAREIIPLIPEPLRDFRYKTYIDTQSESQSTQKYGIFGLLDEFNSYYQGAQAAYDILPWFNGIDQYNWTITRAYMNQVHADYVAHGEFKLYILCYLRYAKEKHPKVYKKIMKNRDFTRAFIAIDQNFTKLIADYYSGFDNQLKFLESKGVKPFLFIDDYMFREPDSVYSHGLEHLHRRAEYAKFLEEINRPENQEVLKELGSL